jgi:hypothetical protein
VAVTCGVGLRPMPRAEQAEGAPRRVELALAMATSLFEPRADRLLQYLGAQATLPWDQLTWLGPGHTLGCEVVPSSASGIRFEALLMVEDALGAPPVALPPYRGDPVRLLWLVPITTSERALAARERSAALLERLGRAGHGVVHRDRGPVA